MEKRMCEAPPTRLPVGWFRCVAMFANRRMCAQPRWSANKPNLPPVEQGTFC